MWIDIYNNNLFLDCLGCSCVSGVCASACGRVRVGVSRELYIHAWASGCFSIN